MYNVIHHSLIRSFAFFICLMVLLPFGVQSQNSIAGLKRQADRYFELSQYRLALQLYRQAGLENTKDTDTRMRIGVSQYEINDVDNAIKTFQYLINIGKTDPIVFYHAAKCYQAKSLFGDAIVWYKRFLQKSKKDDPLLPWVKDELIRCANGARLKYADEQAYVENAGTTINTQYEEYGVRTSPTTIDKIYFNSDREDIERGKAANGNVDIYTTALTNGRWTSPSPLPAHINSGGYDEVCGFSSDGQILYYLSNDGNTFRIKTDTFSAEAAGSYKGIFSGPYPAHLGGADLIFFNDSICLFSSTKEGGYGGYDLYISLLKNGFWTAGLNLGPGINTFYDERFPFLSRNGLTLLYSSNGLASMGGFDIFMSSFDEESFTWSHPVNLAFPINSPLDETHMILSPDGMTAFLSSDRKEGYGEEDIYRVFFKQPFLAHQSISATPTFYQLLQEKGTDMVVKGGSSVPSFEIKEYYISHLFLEENVEILTPQNTKKLDILANLLKIYPKITAELSCFELPTAQRTFNLYFSIKKAEKAAEYLVSKGIQKNRITLKGYGSSFPLVQKPNAGIQSPVYTKLNHRLEITLHEFEKEPVLINIEKIQVPENLLDPKGAKHMSLRHQLFYGVQIASISQILQNQDLESVEEMFIEVDNTQGNYLYMTGMSPTYRDAENVLSKMIQLGFPDARIIPYFNGMRISAASIPEMLKSYPDLQNYIAGQKK